MIWPECFSDSQASMISWFSFLNILWHLEIFPDVDVVDGEVHVKLVSNVVQKFLELFSASGEKISKVNYLNQQNPNVHFAPWNRFQNL